MKSGIFFPLFLLITLLQLAGCATYGNGIEAALQKANEGDYAAASALIESSLSPTGSDRLLYHLELGVLKHLEGDYETSNELLEEASRIVESLQTTSVSDSLVTLMSNPRNGTYSGNEHERVLIYYYKALNYLAIAGPLPEGDTRLDAIEGARIESRRLLLRLQALKNNEGTYDNASSDKERTFSQVMDVFKVLMGNLVDNDALTYRDDAMAHYLTGVSFEMNGEYDDARISYQKAADSYGKGYAEQFRLGEGMVAQAWFDTVRMMQRSGFTTEEWQRVAREHLSEEQQQALSDSRDKAQVLVIEHKGRVPEKRELNLSLAINPELRALQLQPYVFEYTQDELNWFYLLYADKMVFGLVADYLNATRNFRVDFFSKTLFLGPLYDEAERMGLTSAIGNSLRVTVPYYGKPTAYGNSNVSVGGHSYPLAVAASPQQMAIQEQMKQAGPEIRAALARSAVKAMTALSIAQGDSSGFLAFAGKLAAQLTDAAETRSWLLLPAEVHVRRLFLEPGDYTLTLNSQLTAGQQVRNQKALSLDAGDFRLWQVRTMEGSQNSPALPPPAADTPPPPDGSGAEKPIRRLPTKD